MIWRTFSLFNLDVLFYQLYMRFNHTQACLIHSTESSNTVFSSSRNLFIQFSLSCWLAECCKQSAFSFVNNLQSLLLYFLNMNTALLFYWIEITSFFLYWQIKVLVFVKKCCETEIYIIRCHWWCSTSRFASKRDLFISKSVWWNSDSEISFHWIWQFSTSQHHFEKFQIIWNCWISSCIFNFKHSPIIQRQLFENCTSVIDYQIISSLCSTVCFSIQFCDCRNWLVLQIEFKSSCCIIDSSLFNQLCSASLCEVINSTDVIQFWICWIQNLCQNCVFACVRRIDS